MSNLIPWTPSREIAAMQETIDRMFNDVWGTWNPLSRAESTLALDLTENDEAYTLNVNVPGVAPEDINITVHDNVLAIEAETVQDTHEENAKVLLQERRYGKFSRRLTLPRGIDIDNIDSEYTDGVLTLRLPKTEVAQRRRIEVRTPGLLKGKSNN